MTVTDMKNKPARRKRRKQADRREESRERILDAAEELFAKRGFHGVSVREIADASGADTSLLHYYFGAKAALFETVIERRAALVNDSRLASLEAYERDNANAMTAAGIIRAYLEPTFKFMMAGDPGYLNYGALIARINSSPPGEGPDMSASPFDGVVQKLIGLLKTVRPECSEAELYWFYHLMSGAITLSLAQTGRIDFLSGGACRSDDFEAILQHMVQVFGHGLGGLVGNKV
ncbi:MULTISPECIES: TetR/AcrR family transcriptional regulator [Kordiimonas]|jgi:AcrR family transcriptional regulator|uniref:TetR/AcrR family transcriptional regulator n=1 Tax=Kordiimonas TaxID=288021 RepID=UPI00257E5FA8|nr:TetR/AcrR family transcriptional regulator [Kordiimonas sp. UBA4487]